MSVHFVRLHVAAALRRVSSDRSSAAAVANFFCRRPKFERILERAQERGHASGRRHSIARLEHRIDTPSVRDVHEIFYEIANRGGAFLFAELRDAEAHHWTGVARTAYRFGNRWRPSALASRS
jgi:hypothetical protein